MKNISKKDYDFYSHSLNKSYLIITSNVSLNLKNTQNYFQTLVTQKPHPFTFQVDGYGFYLLHFFIKLIYIVYLNNVI